jgi:hypothetical protein
MRARAFAQEAGVTPWVLYYWRQRLAGQARPARRRRSRRVSIARIRVVPDVRAERADLEIHLVSGDRVRVAADVSIETLRRVVQVLRAAC